MVKITLFVSDDGYPTELDKVAALPDKIEKSIKRILKKLEFRSYIKAPMLYQHTSSVMREFFAGKFVRKIDKYWSNCE